MKRAAAFILSLTLVWLQVLASAQLASSPSPDKCGCCLPKQSCCCVEESAPVSSPMPATPAPVNASIDLTAVPAEIVAWILPVTTAAVSAADSSLVLLPAIPLFQRDCALLI